MDKDTEIQMLKDEIEQLQHTINMLQHRCAASEVELQVYKTGRLSEDDHLRMNTTCPLKDLNLEDKT